MNVLLVAREYARVLAHAASGAQADVGAFLRSLEKTAAQTPAVRHFLNHPAIPNEEKVKALLAVAPAAFPQAVGRILLDLIRRRATELLGAIADEMERLEEEKNNVKRVVVTSAAPLSQASQEKLIATLCAYTGGSVKARFATDASLLSGLRIRIGGTIIDNSLKTDLDHIRQQLSAAATT